MSIGPHCRTAYHLRRVYGAAHAKSIFDWQGTPARAFAAYLDNDFEDMFERDDLEIAGGRVRSKRYGISHRHAFTDNPTEEDLEAGYAQARSRHDHLCRKTRDTLRGNKTLLLVYGQPLAEAELEKFAGQIRAYAPRLKFHLIAAAADGADATDASGQAWIGNTPSWDRLLSPYRLKLTRRLILALRRMRPARKKA